MKAFEKYKNAQAYTSNSSHQLIFIFDELLKLLFTAQKALKEEDYETKFKALAKAIEVFYILKSGVEIDNPDESTKAIDMFYGATIVRLENINMTISSPPEDLVLMIDSIGEVRQALAQSIAPEKEEKKESYITSN
ncbi:MAG: hypothetical protein COA94_04405 [Rickettsiales bacterium]|nr:MAG: hypothetical protein COA94_04405 [Rickettsiales bacterium]